MCGIAGIKGFKEQLHPQDIEKMGAVFSYRGPDDQGLFFNGEHRVGFAHRRLSILDTSRAGVQPMTDEKHELVIVFNGEIYNYIELRKILETRGYRFRTQTDTEVILAAYKEWGRNCLERFNGMWAFAIYDMQTREMFMARDRLGIKPLYYYLDDKGVFFFASEIKAILQGTKERPGFEAARLDDYMSFGYIPGEHTLFKGIKRLLPGHYMQVSQNNKIHKHQYWDLNFNQSQDLGLNHYVEKGREILNSAIDLRLRSDVPLGIFLSGGLDSSSVVGLLAPRVSSPLKTFSVAYDFGRQYNETPYARQIAKQFKTDHHELFVTQDQFQSFIPDFVRHMDEPVTESAAISLFFISKLAKEHVTVVLSGEGADEIFAGYDFYKYMLVTERWHRLLGKTMSGRVADRFSRYLPPGHKLGKYLALGARSLEERYKGISTYDQVLKYSLYNNDLKSFVAKEQDKTCKKFVSDLFVRTKDQHPLNRMLYFDTKTWLVDDLLIKADRMSMAASLELRVPFLDYRLVEFAATLPVKYKINKGRHKYLLKQIMKPVLPPAIVNRKKMGFPTPLKQMFQGDLADLARDMLRGPSCMLLDYFDQDTINRILGEHIAQKRDHHRIIWQLIVLETWMRTWLKN